jgi:D-alanyl-D-alanine carboxypeptidase
MYVRGEMRVPIWHEIGMAVLAVCLLALFASTVTPALGFSLKPSISFGSLFTWKGMGTLMKFLPLGILIPFLFRRFQSCARVLLLCGGISLLTELFQIFLKEADTNVWDFLFSLVGAFLGYIIFTLIQRYLPGIERMATVRRSRRREVPLMIRKELEALLILVLLAVVGRGTQIEVNQVRQEKAAQAELERQQEEARRQAEEEEARRLAEEEAKKLKVADSMPELELQAGAACLFSIDDDLILYEKNGTEHVEPASTTKLLTALTVLKYCSEDEVLTAGEEINLISQGASNASLKVGTRGTVKTFLCALLLPSGNDAAYALANYTGCKILGNDAASVDEAVAAFVEAMNALGEELNLEESNFETPDGDEADNQYTCARDMIRIARACLDNDTIMELAGSRSARALFENLDLTYQNTNLLLQPSSEYYNENAIGLKTGSLRDEKYLVAAVELNGHRYVAAVMADTEEGRWEDTETLFEQAEAYH